MKKNVIIGAVIVGIILILIALIQKKDTFGSGYAFDRVSYNAIGSSTSSPATLTGSFTAAGSASSTAMKANNGKVNLVLGGSYTPKSHGSTLYLLVERSLDNGTTFQPYTVLEPTNDETLVYTVGATSTSGKFGIPFTIPGTGTATSGTTMGFSFDLTLAADYIKVLAKESTTSSHGTLHLQTMMVTN